MKTVNILQGFDVDTPKPATYIVGDEPTVADATADQWVEKGLARHKPGPKPEPVAAAKLEHKAPASAD